MTQTDTPDDEVYTRIRNNPKFLRLARSRSHLAWSLSAMVLGAYYVYMLVVAFAPQWLHAPMSLNGAITWGMPVGAAIIIVSWILTGLYVYRANTRFDRLSAEVVEEAKQ